MSRKNLDRLQVFCAMASVHYGVLIAQADILHALDESKPTARSAFLFYAIITTVAAAVLVFVNGKEDAQ